MKLLLTRQDDLIGVTLQVLQWVILQAGAATLCALLFSLSPFSLLILVFASLPSLPLSVCIRAFRVYDYSESGHDSAASGSHLFFFFSFSLSLPPLLAAAFASKLN